MKFPQIKIGGIERVALAMLFFSILAMLCISYYVGYTLGNYGQNAAMLAMRHDAEIRMENLDRFMNERLIDISMLSAKEGTVSDSSATMGAKLAYLRRFEQASQSYASISIFDNNGSLMADTRGLGIDTNQSSSPQVRAALSGKVYTSPIPVVSGILHVPVIYISAPLYGDDGSISGAVVASVLLSRLGEVMVLTEDDLVEVVDSDGTVLFAAYDRGEELVEKSDLLAMEQIYMVYGFPSWSDVVVEDGKPILHVTAREAGFQNYADHGWMTIQAQDRESVLKPLDDIRNRAYVVSLLLALAVFIIALFILNNLFIIPLREFTRVASELEHDNYSERVHVSRKDELGELAAVFNRAIERIGSVEAERKQVDKAKTQFLSITSHELRSPMTPMKAQLQMLEQGYLGKMNREQTDSLRIVIRNADRLDKILVDFLEISRIEAARLKFEFKKTDLAETAREVMKYMEGYMPAKHVAVKSSVRDLPIIEADPDRVSQVLRNLVGNAIKFSPSNGTVEVGARVQGKFIEIWVRDRGMGISPENQKKLFEPFYQVDKTFSRKEQGTGLGLAISRGIVESQNGRIWLESAEGKGTTFHFTVPFEPVREIKSIRVLFSNKADVENRARLAFKEYLGPLGENEFDELQKQAKLSKKDLFEYIDGLHAKGIISAAEREQFKKAMPNGI